VQSEDKFAISCTSSKTVVSMGVLVGYLSSHPYGLNIVMLRALVSFRPFEDTYVVKIGPWSPMGDH
jgi:hypothetical protein